MATTAVSVGRRAGSSTASSRAVLAERLRARLPEIERAALTRLYGISEAPRHPDPDYVEGLRVATRAALEYLLAGVERGEAEALQPPPAVLVQARLATRNRVGLDTVMRRCFAGHALFGDFLMEEWECVREVEPDLLKRLFREQAALLDRMLAAVSEEHLREASSRSAATERRRARLTERLLAGEPLDAAELGYELEAHHLGALAGGAGASDALRGLARTLDRSLLLVAREEGSVWAWLGGRRRLDPEEIAQLAPSVVSPQISLALGEPARGFDGWRLTHQQARAAFPIALRGRKSLVRYAEVTLLASVIQDDLLSTSLRELYLEPLSKERDGGDSLRRTLRAYFAADRNISSAAAALGISRHTVANRLRTIETQFGRSLRAASAECEAALRLEEFERNAPSELSPSVLRKE